MWCSGDVDIAKICTAVWRKARKEHICGECGSKIKIGEEYLRYDGLWCGNWNSHKQCEICGKLYEEYSTMDNVIAFGELWSYLYGM